MSVVREAVKKILETDGQFDLGSDLYGEAKAVSDPGFIEEAISQIDESESLARDITVAAERLNYFASYVKQRKRDNKQKILELIGPNGHYENEDVVILSVNGVIEPKILKKFKYREVTPEVVVDEQGSFVAVEPVQVENVDLKNEKLDTDEQKEV